MRAANHDRSSRRLQRGQAGIEYAIAAAVLAVALSGHLPGTDRSAAAMLVDAFREAWASYAHALSFPL